MKEFEIFTLSNGIRVVHKEVKRPIAHCGLHIAAGSRDELEHEQGLAHFIEHSLFKGTKLRKAYHVLSRMEDVGGELNAFTTKEETVIYSSFLTSDFDRALELIIDIAFHSTFPAREIEKEKEVIIEEINSYLDTPSDSIFDDFEDQVFSGHPLGRNILGKPASVKSFNRDNILHFVDRNYGTNRMVVSFVGNISAQRLRTRLEFHLSDVAENNKLRGTIAPNGYTPQKVTTKRTGYQAHLINGCRAYPADHEKSRVLMLLNNLLGGPGMNSRLNLNIREKYGFTYHIESFYQPYSDTGLFGIYLGTDPGTVPRAQKLIEKELDRLRNRKLGILQLSKAKKQLLGQIAMAQENNASLMLAFGKSLLTFDKIDSFELVKSKIENIGAQDIMDVANEIFQPAKMSSLIFQPN